MLGLGVPNVCPLGHPPPRGSLNTPTNVARVKAAGRVITEKARASVPQPWPTPILACLTLARPNPGRRGGLHYGP